MEILSLIIPLIASVWVYRDATARGYTSGSALLWSLGVFFLLIIFLPIYLITRKSKREQNEYYYSNNYQDGPVKVGESSTASEQISCPHCKNEISSSFVHCPYCGVSLKDEERKCKNCGEKVEEDWNVCPNCGTEQNRE